MLQDWVETSVSSVNIDETFRTWLAENPLPVEEVENVRQADRSVSPRSQLGPLFSPIDRFDPGMDSMELGKAAVLDRTRFIVVNSLEAVFTERRLCKPNAWEDVTAQHLEVLRTTMKAVHTNLKILDATQLSLNHASWKRLGSGEMLDDACVDQMAQLLAAHHGCPMAPMDRDSTIESRGGVSSVPLEDAQTKTGGFMVLGVSSAFLLRTLGQNRVRKTETLPTFIFPWIQTLQGCGP